MKCILIKGVVLVSLCCMFAKVEGQNNMVERINFFSAPVVVQCDNNMDIPLSNSITEETFQHFFEELNHTNYFTILGSLFHYKKELNLNDWFYYVLIRKSVEQVFKHKSENYKTMLCWFLLYKSGYKVQLNYIDDEVMLSVFTTDKVYDMPVREVEGGWFVDITAYHRKGVKGKLTTFNSNFKLNVTGKDFSFQLDKLPKLETPHIEERNYTFTHDNEAFSVDVSVNKSMVQLMYKYPELSVKEHTEISLSNEARMSLVSQLRKLVADKTDYEGVRMLLSFVRQSIKYKTDEQAYGMNNLTFYAEETLYYPYSDCEDRSILFKYLVEEILNLDVIMVDFPEHATTAVLFNTTYGNYPVDYNGKEYTLCDPTGPGNHLKPGDYPTGLKGVKYTILD